jgi:hypothetical protein
MRVSNLRSKNNQKPIDPQGSTFEVLSTKIELSLKKANGISWASIEPNSNVTTWTTFGTTGKSSHLSYYNKDAQSWKKIGTVGTVGGKEALIAGDVPIDLLKKR